MKTTNKCQGSTILSGFHELQQEVHQRLLSKRDIIDEPYEEGYAMIMGTHKREIISKS